MSTTAKKLTDVLGFNADDACSVTPQCADIITDDGNHADNSARVWRAGGTLICGSK